MNPIIKLEMHMKLNPIIGVNKMPDPKIEQFFRVLDGYLMGDLKNMIEIPAAATGGLGYPIVHTILSGMELLGLILSEGKKDEKAFNEFWDKFFIIDNPNYVDSKNRLRKIFRCSIRHGTAHYFLVKFGITITKEKKNHLQRMDSKTLNIDLIDFFEDFKKTYSRIKETLISGKDSALINKFNKGYNKLLRDLQGPRTEIELYIKENFPVGTESTLRGSAYATDLGTMSTSVTKSGDILHIEKCD